MKKFHNNRGETLVEVLASILIASLAVALLFGSVVASSNMAKGTENADEKHYAALTEADAWIMEEGKTPDTGTVTIVNSPISSNTSLQIDIFGGEGMYSYTYKGKVTGP